MKHKGKLFSSISNEMDFPNEKLSAFNVIFSEANEDLKKKKSGQMTRNVAQNHQTVAFYEFAFSLMTAWWLIRIVN